MGKLSFSILFLAVSITILYNTYAPHIKVKRDTPLETHPSKIYEKVFSDQEFRNLVNLAKNTTFLMTIRADAQNEFDFASRPIQADGTCDHSLLHSNKDKTKCIVPARFDVAKQLLMTGGWGAKKESYSKMAARGRFFQNFWASFNEETPEIMPEVMDLFERKDYRKDAIEICEGKEYLDPMQASILVALPGQEVGIHIDTPWFVGADRSKFPLWLLAAMRMSGLYDDININQIQGVSYLHEWTNSEEMGGGFYFYDQGPAGDMKLVEAKPNRGLIVDGTIMAHGTQTFMPGKEPEPLEPNTDYKIKFNQETKQWDVHELDSGKFFKSYGENEMRITLVWRQRCFKDEQAFQEFENKRSKENQLELTDVVDNLLENLVKKGVIESKPVEEIDQVMAITSNYIKYPFPDENFPYNYCIISKLLPFTQPIVDYFC